MEFGNVRDNQVIVWLIVAALVLVFLNLPASVTGGVKSVVHEAVAPLQEMVGGAWVTVRQGASNVRGYGGMLAENQKLSEQVTKLQAEVTHLQNLESENSVLRKQLGFQHANLRRLIPCEILGRDPDGWWQMLRLNKGSGEGITTNRAVIAIDGLIGKTVRVTPHTADVLLLSDPNCQVSARIQRTGAFGILSGRGPNWQGNVVCRLDYLNKNVEIVEGDEVVTSGLGGVFPAGLSLGKIDRIYTDRSGLYQYADVISKAEMGMLSYVFVVADTPQEARP
jgi:rod shape-determining protein MreC